MKRKYNWHCYQCGNKKNRKQFNNQDNFICSKCKYANKSDVTDESLWSVASYLLDNDEIFVFTIKDKKYRLYVTEINDGKKAESEE